MTSRHMEGITVAKQCAELLSSDIIAAHKSACQDDPVLEIVLSDLISDSVAIVDRLARLERALKS